MYRASELLDFFSPHRASNTVNTKVSILIFFLVYLQNKLLRSHYFSDFRTTTCNCVRSCRGRFFVIYSITRFKYTITVLNVISSSLKIRYGYREGRQMRFAKSTVINSHMKRTLSISRECSLTIHNAIGRQRIFRKVSHARLITTSSAALANYQFYHTYKFRVIPLSLSPHSCFSLFLSLASGLAFR